MDTPEKPEDPTGKDNIKDTKGKSWWVRVLDNLGLRRFRILLKRKYKHFYRHPNSPLQSVKKMALPLTQHRYSRWISIVAVLVMMLMVYRCTSLYNKKKANTPRPTPVVVASVGKKDVPIFISALGTVTPNYTITVRTQINGQLLRVLFKEGQTVHSGELLAEIDPRPYQAQLLQFEGQLARDRALLANAETDLKRYETLYKQDSVSEQVLATQKSLVQQLEGTVKFDEGQVEGVKLNLVYTQISSPVEGRVGLRLVDAGNYVQTTDVSGLFVINTVQPISVIFSIPADNLPQVVQQINAGNSLKVEAYDRSEQKLLATGVLSTIDNQIDPTTGTIKFRAEFNNEAGILFPNQFVNIKLQVETLNQTLVVPTPAIQSGVRGNFVYLVNANQTVSLKPVSIQGAEDGTTAINADILPGQSVVIVGAEKLVEGSSVIVLPDRNHHHNTSGSSGRSSEARWTTHPMRKSGL